MASNFLLFTPLEQFELFVLFPFLTSIYDFTITTITVYLIINYIIINLAFWVTFVYNPEFIPVRLQFSFESLYKFVHSIVLQQATREGTRWFPLFMFIFVTILFANLIGLVPFSFTVTSHIAITFAIALSLNIGLVIIGFVYNGLGFLKLFVPNGAPLWLLPLIVVIEFFSYLIRTFSLSIRLFTNMTAGHTLLHMIVSFALVFLTANAYIFFIVGGTLAMAVLVLEFAIAFLQTYVFVILFAIYLNDSLHPSH